MFRRFPGVCRLFAGLPSVIAAELAASLDDPVAKDHKGDGVGPHRQPHGAGSLGATDGARHLGVAHDPGWRDLQQRPPDADLKVGAAHVELKGAIRRFFVTEHLVDHRLCVIEPFAGGLGTTCAAIP